MLESEYIVAIAVGGLYLLMCLIALIIYLYRRNKDIALKEIIRQTYNNSGIGVNYDFALFDEETAQMVSASRIEGQLSIDDIILDKVAAPTDEGMEEITGNYKPD